MSNTPGDKAKLQAIIKGSRAILEKKTFAESARSIFDYCREMTGAVSGYVALLSPDGHENEVLFLEAGGMACTVDPKLPMPIRGLRAESYETHRAVYHNDFMNSPWVNFMPQGHVGMKNVMFAPLNVDGATVGLIGLANKAGDFTDEDAEMATAFGELAAIALMNSRYLDGLNEKNAKLEHAMAQIRTLKGLLPMCSHCKNIRDKGGNWHRLEEYLSRNTDAQMTHGVCPECVRDCYPDLADEVLGKSGTHGLGE